MRVSDQRLIRDGYRACSVLRPEDVVNNRNPDRNSSDHMPEESQDEIRPDEQGSGQANPPMKGTDIPATTNLEDIDREKGKRTTM